ncbi:MAG: family 16 glycoside hydrolase [bacterium]
MSMLTTMCIDGNGWAQSVSQWKIHDMNRPRPPVVTPPKNDSSAPPPSDATILFDGKDLSQWSDMKGEPAKWKVENGYMEIGKESGDIRTRMGWGDVQLHVEWAAPTRAQDQGQSQGNSGVYLMGQYEVQVLDSYQSQTYADGQAAGIYGQYPPLVNACRAPGEWQSFEIIFRRPRFAGDGKLVRPARLTVLHNGMLVQDNVALWGPTNWLEYNPYQAHPDRLPISLQDHGSPVRYRNIWLRELPEPIELDPPVNLAGQVIALPSQVIERYAGRYEVSPGRDFTIKREGDKLLANFYGDRWFEIVAHSEREFSMKRSAVDLKFDLDSNGHPRSFVFHIGGTQEVAKKVAPN